MRNHLTTRTAKSATAKRSLTLLGVVAIFAALAGYAIAAPRGPAVPEPAIVSGPSVTTRSTSARFAFRGARGVSFECSLDGDAFRSCSSPKSYGSLRSGSHEFAVRARNARGQRSAAAERRWRIDTTAPSVSIHRPEDGKRYGLLTWGAECRGGTSICGDAADPSGVARVDVSLRNAAGRYWNGASFSSRRELFREADGDTRWGLRLPTPPDGWYRVRVRATDRLGNASRSGDERAASFELDMTRPPAPAITEKPTDPSADDTPTFAFASAEAGVEFWCRLENQPFYEPCGGQRVTLHLRDGLRTLSVRSRDAAGNYSDPTRYTWLLDTTPDPDPDPRRGLDFTIGGGYDALLFPGASGDLAVTVTNPNAEAILVTRLTATIQPGSSRAGCDGPENLAVTQSDVSAANPLTVPANGSVTLPSGGVSAPQVAMLNLPTNQDACKDATFTFAYAGEAHAP